MTPDELQILKAIAQREVSTFIPAGREAGQAQRFDRLVETLQSLQRLGWIELEVSVRSRSRALPSRAPQSKYAGAAARCTAEGRRVLSYLGEG
jgi:predicted transcriptional regulator